MNNVGGGGGGFVGGPDLLIAASGGVDAETPASGTSGEGASANPTSDVGTPRGEPDATSGNPDPAETPAAPGSVETHLTQAQLDAIIEAAIARWQASGLSAEQAAYLQNVTFTISDMAGANLGAASAGSITIDADAAGYGWYVDANPGDDAEFGNGAGSLLYSYGSQLPAGHIDLLTTVMHELGHQLGLEDSYDIADRAELMYGYITTGERRLPGLGEADGAVVGSIDHEAFAVGPLSLGTLPAGKSVTITYDATVNAQTDRIVTDPSNQGTVTTSNAGNTTTNTVVTPLDDLTLGGTIFIDGNGNGTFDAGEGVAGVSLTLYADTNNNGSFDAGIDLQVTTTTTIAAGAYSFSGATGLAAGDYILQVNQANFNAGGALQNARISVAGQPDPDNNADNDDNGAVLAGQGIVTQAITLSFNTEPTNDGTGHGDINNTLDIGVFSNTPPTANATSGAGTEDSGTRIAILLSGTDADLSDAVQSFSLATLPAHGQLFLSASGGTALTTADVIAAVTNQATIFFQPDADWNSSGAPDSFTYTAFDGDDASTPATATITVTAVQDIVNDTASVQEDTATNIDVLANDTFEGTPAITGTTNGANGTVVVNNNGTAGDTTDDFLVYTPGANFTGPDSFTYTVTSGGVTETATVNVTVTAVADTPSVTPGTTSEDTQSAAGLVILPNPADGGSATHFKITNIQSGTLFLADGTTQVSNGTFITVAQGGAGLRFTPAPDFHGNGTFDLQASLSNVDAGLGGGIVTAAITVTPVADANTDTLATNEDTAISANVITGTNGASADSFEDAGRTLTAVTQGANGTVGFAADGTITYTPNGNFNGPDSFTYTVTAGGATEVGNVSVNVSAVNDPATLAVAAAAAFIENGAAASLDGGLTLTDADGGPGYSATVAISGGFRAGDVLAGAGGTYDAATQTFTTTLAPNASLAALQTALRSLTYASSSEDPGTQRTLTWTISDGSAANATSTWTSAVNITAINDAPTAADRTVTTLEDTSYVFNAASFGFSDVDNNGLGAVIINGLPVAGSLTANGVAVTAGQSVSGADILGGRLVFAPAADANGAGYASFTFQVQDDGGTANGGVDLDAIQHVLTIDVIPVADITDIIGTPRNNRLNGTAGADRIIGLAGNDIIRGNAGDDILIGGRGVDRLYGGAGDDVFTFTSYRDSAPFPPSPVIPGVFGLLAGLGRRDVIVDFTRGEDTIDLSGIDANSRVDGNQQFAWRGKGDFTHRPGQLIERIFNLPGTSFDRTVVYGDINGDALADFQIELRGLKNLAASDFIL